VITDAINEEAFNCSVSISAVDEKMFVSMEKSLDLVLFGSDRCPCI